MALQKMLRVDSLDFVIDVPDLTGQTIVMGARLDRSSLNWLFRAENRPSYCRTIHYSTPVMPIIQLLTQV